MSIRKVERETLDKFKPGWKKNPRTGLWYTYEVDYVDPETGVRRRRRGFHSEQEAQKFVHDLGISLEMRRLGLVAKSTDFPLLSDVLQRSIGDLATKRAKVRATTVFRSFLGTLPDHMTCDRLRTKHYKDYADARLRAGVKPETANRETAMVMAALKKAHLNFPELEDWIPPKGYYVAADRRKKKERVITGEEQERIVRWLRAPKCKGESERDVGARRRAALIFEFALMTGLRHGEIVGLRKSEIGKDEFTVWRPKTKVLTTFPLTDEMQRIVSEATELFPGDYVFSAHGRVMGRTWSTLKRACEAVGVPWGRDGGVVLHTARHTFITRLLQAGVDIATIQSFSSHSDREMVMKYSHATEDTRRRALGMLASEDDVSEDELAEIYKAVRSKKMSFEEFKRKLGPKSGVHLLTKN